MSSVAVPIQSGRTVVSVPKTYYIPSLQAYKTLYLHSEGRYEVRGNIQQNWTKAWVTDEQGRPYRVHQLTTSAVGYWDGEKRMGSRTDINTHSIEQGPLLYQGPLPPAGHHPLCHQAWVVHGEWETAEQCF